MNLSIAFGLTTILISLTLTTSSRPTPNSMQSTNVSNSFICWNCWSEHLQFLASHNLVRMAHLELPLLWDPRLEAYASSWAQQRKGDCQLRHSFPEDGFVLGENVFWGPGSGWGPSDAVKAWADEARWYSYASNACTEGRVCGHYTQIVWRSTTRVGCARVVCDTGDVFMTCNYYPPGNVVGERPY